MNEKISDLILSVYDPGTRNKVESIHAGKILEDATLTLNSKRKVQISDLVRNGPLLLTFIRGTWCPFCRLHMQKLRDWVSKLEGKNGSIVVVSTESPEVLTTWLEQNPVPYIFASDEEYELMDLFGVRIHPRDFAQAATFLIDSNLTVRLAYTGKRTTTMYKTIEEKLAETNN